MIQPNWITPQQIKLEKSEVHIWKIPLEFEEIIELREILSEEERAKADRFHFPQHRREYTISHAALRLILSRYLSPSPDEYSFVCNDYGKPSLQREFANLRFNLSHTRGKALLAVTWDREIGVDIERIRENINDEQMAKRFFSPNEAGQLATVPENMRKKAFFLCWTRKEAYIKARGKGLSIPLDKFEVTVIPEDPVKLVPEEKEKGNHWNLWNIPMKEDDYTAAIVVQGAVSRFALFEWSR